MQSHQCTLPWGGGAFQFFHFQAPSISPGNYHCSPNELCTLTRKHYCYPIEDLQVAISIVAFELHLHFSSYTCILLLLLQIFFVYNHGFH
jgi:hypothetical protein